MCMLLVYIPTLKAFPWSILPYRPGRLTMKPSLSGCGPRPDARSARGIGLYVCLDNVHLTGIFLFKGPLDIVDFSYMLG